MGRRHGGLWTGWEGVVTLSRGGGLGRLLGGRILRMEMGNAWRGCGGWSWLLGGERVWKIDQRVAWGGVCGVVQAKARVSVVCERSDIDGGDWFVCLVPGLDVEIWISMLISGVCGGGCHGVLGSAISLSHRVFHLSSSLFL